MNDSFFPVHVLLVEDDEGDELLVLTALGESEMPVEVVVVPDGVEALAYLRRQGRYAEVPFPDLVLLDLKLPRKGGLEVLEEMKNDPALRRTPVIILTTSYTPEDVVRAYDLQASAYLTKPDDLGEYQQVMKTLTEFCLGVMRFPERQEEAAPQTSA